MVFHKVSTIKHTGERNTRYLHNQMVMALNTEKRPQLCLLRLKELYIVNQMAKPVHNFIRIIEWERDTRILQNTGTGASRATKYSVR
jgi:hypothetical protein